MTDYSIPMAKIKITQVRSRIHCTKRHKLNLDALGLRKMNATVEHEATPQILGMVNKVKHLLQVTDI
jgi:large subunit ribosomal protein L30